MYKQFFGLRVSPFSVNPDPRFLFVTQHTREALACLSYGIKTHKGFILLTGEVGTGKTTLLNKLLEWLRSQRMASAFVFNPRLEVIDFLEYVLADFGIPCDTRNKSQILIRLNHWLLERYRCGETATLIIDEAQHLSSELLEEVRLLTNLETATDKLLQIVLCGQPELEDMLREPRHRQIRQRIMLRSRTHPLTLQETAAYIAQRARLAGSNGTPLFAPEAIEAIYKYVQGIPRLTNLLCENALISAYVDQKRTVTADIVDEVAREFELDKIAPVMAAQAAGENVKMMEAVRMFSARQRGNPAPVPEVPKDKKQI